MAFTFVATGESPDGSRQVFAIENNGQIQTRYDQTTGEGTGWTAWANFATPTGGVTSLCVGNLPDKRMQLFATDKSGNTYSCWKVSTASNALFTSWTAF